MGDPRIWPAEGGDSVTPNDSTTFEPSRALYVGVSGDVKVEMVNGDTLTFTALAAGVVHPLSVVRVYSTDTDATNIVVLR